MVWRTRTRSRAHAHQSSVQYGQSENYNDLEIAKEKLLDTTSYLQESHFKNMHAPETVGFIGNISKSNI
jgi:hypothetical protein